MTPAPGRLDTGTVDEGPQGQAGRTERRWSTFTPLLILIPLTAVGLGAWVLTWVGAYPHHDLGAAYAMVIGWLAVLGGLLLVVVVGLTTMPHRIIASLLGIVPVFIGVLGLWWMAELDDPPPDPCQEVRPHHYRCTEPGIGPATPAPTQP